MRRDSFFLVQRRCQPCGTRRKLCWPRLKRSFAAPAYFSRSSRDRFPGTRPTLTAAFKLAASLAPLHSTIFFSPLLLFSLLLLTRDASSILHQRAHFSTPAHLPLSAQQCLDTESSTIPTSLISLPHDTSSPTPTSTPSQPLSTTCRPKDHKRRGRADPSHSPSPPTARATARPSARKCPRCLRAS